MKLIATVRVAGLVVCLSLTATGQSLDATFLNANPSMSVVGSYDGGVTFGSYVAGLLNFNVGQAFCSEPDQTINTGNSVRYTIQPNTALPNYSTIARIFGGYFHASQQTPVDAAGAQWAIWEVLQDGVANPSFASGEVRIQDAANSAVAARAMEYLNNLDSLPAIEVIYATNATRQDMLFVTIPEVGAFTLGALGSALLMFRRRR